jgi:microcystin-dependent protein
MLLGASGTHALGSTGGAETVTLTTGQMPSHNHGGATGVESNTHKHEGFEGGGQKGELGSVTGGTVFEIYGPGGQNFTAHVANWLTKANNATHTHSISSQGGGEAHPNMPPYFVGNYIIRAL